MSLVKKDYYRLSPSSINAMEFMLTMVKWSKDEEMKENSVMDFVNKMKGVPFEDTEFTIRGRNFEDLVSDGKIKLIEDRFKLSKLEKQKELDSYVGDFRFNGFLDFYDERNKIIYDTKRTNKYRKSNYEKSPQTYFYFFMLPEAKEFRYVVASSESLEPVPKDMKINILTIKRDDLGEDEINNYVYETTKKFIRLLKKMQLVDDYQKNYLDERIVDEKTGVIYKPDNKNLAL